jgi:hypothetical protein
MVQRGIESYRCIMQREVNLAVGSQVLDFGRPLRDNNVKNYIRGNMY